MHPSEITDWKEFLKNAGCDSIIDYGDWIMCKCLFHNQSDTSRPSMGINKDTGDSNCFGCGWHKWEDLCKHLGIDADNYVDGIRHKMWEHFKKKMFKDNTTKYHRFQLPTCVQYGYNCLPYYMNESSRKYFETNNHFSILDEKTRWLFNKHGIAYCSDPSSKYYESVIFPISDEKGVLYFQARYIGDKGYIARWRHPTGSPLWKTYWGWEDVKDGKYVVFTEGITDSLKLRTWDLPAIPAKNFSIHQMKMLLRSPIDTIFLFYDNDEAGINYTKKAIQLFQDSGKTIKRVLYWDSSKDPGCLESPDSLMSHNPELLKCVM